MTKNNTKNDYTDEFKRGIANQVKSGKTYRQVSSEFGVGLSAIGLWVKEAEEIKTDDNEIWTAEKIKQLQKEKLALAEENEILKKAIAIFTPNSK